MNPAFLCVVLLALVLSAEASDAPRLVHICKVLHETEPQKTHSVLEREIGPNETGKFRQLQKDLAPKPDGEYLTVIWKTLSKEPLPRVAVTLYFRQAHLPQLQSGAIQMDLARHGTTYSQFQVIGDAHRQGGPITAWTVA